MTLVRTSNAWTVQAQCPLPTSMMTTAIAGTAVTSQALQPALMVRLGRPRHNWCLQKMATKIAYFIFSELQCIKYSSARTLSSNFFSN